MTTEIETDDRADDQAGPPDVPHYRAFEGSVEDVLPGERAVISVINTRAVDRFKTVIDPRGCDLTDYNKNRVVLWQHGNDPARRRIPIARNQWIKYRRAQGDLIAKTVFAKDEFSDGLLKLYQDEVLKGWSVRFEPKGKQSYGPPTAEELRKAPDWAACRCVFRSWDLIEYSAVDLPGNPDTITLAVSRGYWVPDPVRARIPAPAPVPPKLPPLPPADLSKLPPLRGRTLDQATAEVLTRARDLGRAELAAALADARELARGMV